MDKRHVVSAALAPLLATTAFTLLPAGAQGAPCEQAAEPRICENGVLLTETKRPMVAWGPIELKSATASGKCITSFYGFAWNEEGVAKGEVVGWSTTSCTGSGALAGLETPYLYATPERPPTGGRKRGLSSLPWRLQGLRGVREEKEVILQASGIGSEGLSQAKTQCYPAVEGRSGAEVAAAEPAGCVVLNTVVISRETGAVLEEISSWGYTEATGVSGFGNGLDPSTEQFEGAASYHLESVEFGRVTTTGSVKLMGAEDQSLITAK